VLGSRAKRRERVRESPLHDAVVEQPHETVAPASRSRFRRTRPPSRCPSTDRGRRQRLPLQEWRVDRGRIRCEGIADARTPAGAPAALTAACRSKTTASSRCPWRHYTTRRSRCRATRRPRAPRVTAVAGMRVQRVAARSQRAQSLRWLPLASRYCAARSRVSHCRRRAHVVPCAVVDAHDRAHPSGSRACGKNSHPAHARSSPQSRAEWRPYTALEQCAQALTRPRGLIPIAAAASGDVEIGLPGSPSLRYWVADRSNRLQCSSP
jgi:hypothetical protein